MLAPHEFSIGPVASATGITLVLRRHEREASFLVSAASGQLIAIFLDGEFRFSFMGSAEATGYAGILVPNVSVEIDETSLLGPSEGEPLGVLVRKHTRLSVRAKRDMRGATMTVHVVDGLPACHENESAAFSRWQIALGEGMSKRILMTIDALKAPAAAS